METTFIEHGDAGLPNKRVAALFGADRQKVFNSVRVILNEFEMHDARQEEAEGDLRCIVGIDGWLRHMEVEFKINDALPQRWRSRISEIVELGHRKDEKFPTMSELLTSNRGK